MPDGKKPTQEEVVVVKGLQLSDWDFLEGGRHGVWHSLCAEEMTGKFFVSWSW